MKIILLAILSVATAAGAVASTRAARAVDDGVRVAPQCGGCQCTGPSCPRVG